MEDFLNFFLENTTEIFLVFASCFCFSLAYKIISILSTPELHYQQEVILQRVSSNQDNITSSYLFQRIFEHSIKFIVIISILIILGSSIIYFINELYTDSSININ
jgi:hypothetical protein